MENVLIFTLPQAGTKLLKHAIHGDSATEDYKRTGFQGNPSLRELRSESPSIDSRFTADPPSRGFDQRARGFSPRANYLAEHSRRLRQLRTHRDLQRSRAGCRGRSWNTAPRKPRCNLTILICAQRLPLELTPPETCPRVGRHFRSHLRGAPPSHLRRNQNGA